MIDLPTLHTILAGAQTEVKVLGVVPFDLDWKMLLDAWAKRGLQKGPRVSVLLESDNQLFSKSFLLDSDSAQHRRSFRELLFIRDRAMQMLSECAGALNCDANILYLDIPISVIQVDGRLLVATWLYSDIQGVEELSEESPWSSAVRNYSDLLFGEVGRKYAAGEQEELLELFDHNRVPRGIYPRHSFYDTDYAQLVVWALIFDRKGRLLIHRRADNAKDNRGMWDKSVGGHADFSRDVDTSRAVAREVVEELFTDEIRTRTDFTAWTVSDSDILYLGEWRPEKRRHAPFAEIAAFQREWTFFRLRDSTALYSPRQLPGKGLRRLRVIADVFLVVGGAALSDDGLGSLRNSKFKLLEVAELKTFMDRALRGEEIPGFDPKNRVPKFTPDLVNILTGGLRDVLEEFSAHIKRFCV